MDKPVPAPQKKPESTSEKKSPQTVAATVLARRSHRHFAPLGFAMMILALIGLIWVIFFCVDLTSKLLDNTREKTKFERILYPVVMFDPGAFDSPSQLDAVTQLQIAMWTTLLDPENDGKYSYNDSNLLVVPASDLDVAAKKLFGDTIQLEHQTMTPDYTLTYVYDAESASYMIPVMGQMPAYTPKVEKITKKGDTYLLTVGYVPPTTLWNIDLDGKRTEPTPDKYMQYEMKKVKGGYQLVAIRDMASASLSSASSAAAGS